MKRLVFILFSLLQISVYGQGVFELKGVLKNSTDSLDLPYCTVIIEQTDGAKNNLQLLTDSQGYFKIKLPIGTYSLYAYYMGTRYKIKDHVSMRDRAIDMKEIYIAVDVTKLKEVIVVAQRPFIKYDQDKILINMSANAAMEKGSVADGLMKLPGVNLSTQGALSLYGMYAISIYIDDRPANMNKEQLTSYLSSLSVDDVDVIEIIDNPGAQYGKNIQAVLNIKLKRRAQNGVNGFVSGAAEYFRLFSGNASGRLNVNRGISKNYISYYFSDYRRMYNTEIKYDHLSIDKNRFSLNEEERLSPKRTHWIGAGTDLALNESSILGLKVSLGKTDNKFNNSSQLQNIKGSFLSSSLINADYKALMGNLYYAYSGRKVKWVNNIDYSKNIINRDDIQTVDQRQSYFQEIDEDYSFYRLSSDATAELFPKFNLLTGIIAEFNRTNTLSEKTGNVSTYLYNENNYAAYLSLNYKYKDWFASSGLRANIEKSRGEFDKYDMDTSLVIFQPSLLLSKDFGSKHQVKLSYNRSYIRPSFRDMIPFDSYTGAFVSRVGNPDLRISKEDLISLSYSFLKAAMVELSFSHTANPIVESIMERDSKVIISKINLEKSDYFRFLTAIPVPYINRNKTVWMGTTYFAIQRQYDKGIIGTEPYHNKFTATYLQHVESISLPSGWYFDTKVTYYSSLVYGVYRMERQWWIDASVSKSIGDFKISIQANDLFNSNKAVGAYHSKFSNISFAKNWNYPSIKLSVTYSFGLKKLDAYKTRTNLIKETQRLNTNPDQGISSKANNND